MEGAFAAHYAAEWIDAWSAHDLDGVLSHFGRFRMTSPVYPRIAGEPSGMLRGKAAVGVYWQKALGLNCSRFSSV